MVSRVVQEAKKAVVAEAVSGLLCMFSPDPLRPCPPSTPGNNVF